jgi:hypothetical protein
VGIRGRRRRLLAGGGFRGGASPALGKLGRSGFIWDEVKPWR